MIGMFWFLEGKPLSEQLPLAVQYYARKYGKAATTCRVHPVTLGDAVPNVDGVKVEPFAGMQRGHLWIGGEG